MFGTSQLLPRLWKKVVGDTDKIISMNFVSFSSDYVDYYLAGNELEEDLEILEEASLQVLN